MQHCNLRVGNKEIPFLTQCSYPCHQELPSAAFSFEVFLFLYLQTLQLLVMDNPEKAMKDSLLVNFFSQL